MAKNTKKNDNNIRQFGSTASNLNGQNQILSALDTLGAKLVRSESERETMRRLLNEALEAQDRLETQLERSQIHIQRRIDQMEDGHAALSDEDKAFIEEQKQHAQANKELLEDQVSRQLTVEDKLRDSLHTIQKMQRRLDAQEQKRAKLQRRIERVENIASDAQNALEAKAMVLLTDQSEQVRHLQLLQQQQASQAMATLHHLHDTPANDVTPKKWNSRLKSVFSGSGSILAMLLALGLGWSMANSLNQQPTAFILNEDGQLATIDLRSFNTTPIESPPVSTAQTSSSITNEINALETDWITEDILTNAITDADANALTTSQPAEEAPTETIQTPDLTIDRDLTLPDAIKDLEDKAFARVPEAQHDLGALYTAGQAGVTQNYERAGIWFEQAAQQGIANAAYNLGVLYQQGLGRDQDLQRALDWYRRAAQLGHPEAQYNLGIAYIEGVGTRYNPNMAAAFFQQAALGGIAEAAYNLGLILENGLLGEVRLNDAMTWYRGSADLGNNDAAQALATLSNETDIPREEAGLLSNGESLASYMRPSQTQSLDETSQAAETVAKDVDLGTLVPTKEQIIVAQIQEQLRMARLYNGPQDGIVGAGTVKAIKDYQRQEDLAVDGAATSDLLTYMLRKGTG